MRQFAAVLVIIVFSLTTIIYGQTFSDICRNGPTSSTDPRWQKVPNRFEIITEAISGNELLELSQAFALDRDAIALTTSRGPINIYWNFITNEQFEVLYLVNNNTVTPKCFRQMIDKSETSVITPKTLFVKPSILLGYTPRDEVNPSWGITYVGDTELRGIPVNKFVSCFDVPDIQSTVAATYYISDVTKFQAYLRFNQSLILQMDVIIQNRNGGTEEYKYNVFRYIPNPNPREERQALETPEGVYCPERISTLQMPQNVPERLSSNSEAFVAQASGSIYSTHGVYDTEYRITRFDVWYPDPFNGPEWLHFTEIHDFAVGLNYRYNYTNRQCVALDIDMTYGDAIPVDGKPNVVQMSSPQHLFLMDDMDYQYTGEKRCRDHVWCNVWIGEGQITNDTVQHREWYWASRINGEAVKEPFLVKSLMKTYVNELLTFSVETTVFNYVRDPMTLFEVDSTLTDCYRALGPAEKFNLAVLSFTIINNKGYPVLANLNFFRIHVFETLFFAIFVRPTRISNIIVDKDGDNILVTFTLLDAPPRTGPVEYPLKETSLDTAIDRLNSAIDSNALVFRARNGTKEVLLVAKAGSLNTQHKSAERRGLSSGPQITGLWLGFIIVGIVFGGIGAYFAYGKYSK